MTTIHTGFRVTWADDPDGDTNGRSWPCVAISEQGTDLPRWNGFADVYMRRDDAADALEAFPGCRVMDTDEGLIVRWPDVDTAEDDMLPLVTLPDGRTGYVHLSGYTLSYTHDFPEER